MDHFMDALIKRLWRQADSLAMIEMTKDEANWLITPKRHPSLLARRRTTIIVSRARLLSGLFAVLTPIWILLDVMVFPREVWFGLAFARLAASFAFFVNLAWPRRMESIRDAYWALGLLLVIPTVFFVYSYQHMEQFDLIGIQAAFAAGYAFLPFVMLAGLSVFPLTLTENLVFAFPMLLSQIVAAFLHLPVFNWPTVVASFWLLILISGVSIMAGVSQLAFMIVLVRESIRDKLTGSYSRRSGEELLELQFNIAVRNKAPLSLAFIDLDHFKNINDQFGHETGDRILANAANRIRTQIRNTDTLVRWGGEEFILILPNMPANSACAAIQRVRKNGFGKRPDDVDVTASIGLAERIRDGLDSWHSLVARTDEWMYQAKQSGRDRLVGCQDEGSSK